MDKTPAYTALQQAILFLKGKRIIKNDSDLAAQMGYTKGTVSAYISGNSKPSEDFLTKFENLFNIKLSDYEGVEVIKPNVATPENAIPTTKNEESLHKLIDSNADLVITNKKLTDLLERAMINSGNSPQVQHSQACLERIAEQGAGLQLSWKTKAEGLKVLGNFLTETVLKKEKVNK